VGGVSLGIALALLIIGETIGKGRLEGWAFLTFWTTCFALTLTALVAGFLDARAVRQRTRQEHRELLEEALKEVEEKARRKRENHRG
jgi:hypothetical protein